MSKFSKTWWGQRFLEALESFTDSGRLSRGRSYARNGKVKEYQISKGKITAKVRGSVNPYFGVYKEPLYQTEISLTPISTKEWKQAIASLSSKASFVAKLLMNEMPDNIEEAFAQFNLHLLPYNSKDFQTKCSCPDWSNPCKHIAGVYYLVANAIDQDPFLLLEMRGISRDKLHQELRKTPLGQILSEGMSETEIPPELVESYYTKPTVFITNQKLNPKNFWQGEKRLPETIPHSSSATIPAILVKKGGDYPAFWEQDRSFLDIMTEFYRRIRHKNQKSF